MRYALRFYVQRTLPAERALGAFKLTACPPSPFGTAATAGPRIRLVHIALSFRSRRPVFTRPTAGGTYVWRLFVTPYSADGGAPNEAGTFEARARVEQPHVFNFHVAYVRRGTALLMTGRLIARGKPRAGVRIRFYAARSTGGVILARLGLAPMGATPSVGGSGCAGTPACCTSVR